MMWGHNTRARSWSDEETATTQRMWADGFSASVISLNLEGRSRNAVIGKLHRLGGYQRPYEQPTTRIREGKPVPARPPRVRTRKPKPPRTPYIEPAYIPVEPIKFIDRTMDQCAFIPGDPRMGARAPEIMCCGAKTVNDSSWCSQHFALVYQPASKRERVRDGSSARFVWESAA
jgi:GcrA cell cycle regulator